MKKRGKLKWILLVIVVLAVISAALGSTGDSKSDPSGNDHKKTENQIMESEQTSAVPETEEVKTGDSNAGNAPEENEPEEDAADADPSLTMGQKNALAKAELYLNIGGFSHDGLIKQWNLKVLQTRKPYLQPTTAEPIGTKKPQRKRSNI